MFNYRTKFIFLKAFKGKRVSPILIKEEQMLELELKGRNQSITNSQHYALQLYPNALQTKLQSRR